MSTFKIKFPYYYKTYYEESYYRRHRGDWEMVSSEYLSSSAVNDFIPYHALLGGKLYSSGDNKELLYHLSCPATASFSPKSYSSFFSHMRDSPEWVRLAKQGITGDFRCRSYELLHIKGGLIIPLITLAINKTHLFTFSKEKPDHSQFFLIVDKSFLKEEEYSTLYRNTLNHYLEEASKVVNVITTPSIKQLCYKFPVITPVKANTIMEQRNLMRKLNSDTFAQVRHNVL